jgi:hypothetical protein
MGLLLIMSCSDNKDNPDDEKGNGGNGDAPNLEDIEESDICEDLHENIDEVSSRVMLLEDFSTSMSQEGGQGRTKWSIAVDAIATMVGAYESSIAFGLDLFPSGSGGGGGQASCEVGDSVLVDVAFDNADTINNTLDGQFDNGLRATPLLLAMSNFLDPSYAPDFTNGKAGGYLVVISDGMDTCGTEGEFNQNLDLDDALLTDITRDLLNAGIRTFVIGFGDGIDQGQLNAIAAAGGTPFDEYFNAQDEQQLNDALSTIGEAVVVSCRYQLGNVSEDADVNNTNIYFDGEGIARGNDCSGGADWTWGNDEMTIIEFCPDACERLENEVEELRVIVMCSHDDVIVV